MSNFAFLAAEFPAVHEAAVEAERQAAVSPTAAAFFAGKAVEVAVKWAFRTDPGSEASLSGQYRRTAARAELSTRGGRSGVRQSEIHQHAAQSRRARGKDHQLRRCHGSGKELFHVCFWLARTYARKSKPADGLAFDAAVLSRRDDVLKKAFVQIKAQQAELDAKNGELTKLLTDKQNLDDELTKLRAAVAAARKAAEAQPDRHNYNEAETRDRYIDLLLREAGWALDKPDDTEFRVEGMPNNEGIGFVDYVLWGADGKPLGLVEAKRTRKDARVGQQQAKLYADCLEARFGQRPVIFYSNGYEHWIWDDTRYPPRQIGGFYKRDELELVIQRRTRPEEAGLRSYQPQDRRTPVPAPGDSKCRAKLRAGRRAQGAARHGDGRRQDPHGDRAGRSADARQLGQASAVPRRPGGTGEPGGR